MRRLLVGLLLCASVPMAGAAVPLSVPFQGRLANAAGQMVADGSYNVRFTIYNAPAGPQAVTGEFQTFSGASVTLSHSPVVVNSEVVRKSDNTVTYTRGVAYNVDYASGVITRTSAAAIPDGTQVKVDYQWTGRVLSDSTQTVQTKGGLFTAPIGIANLSALTGDDWVEVLVDRGGAWEALSPRIKLASVPYALQVGLLDGAYGGNIQGDISVDGYVSAGRTVTGSGASYKVFNIPFTEPGVVGNGVSGTGGVAPGVRAVGSNNGTGLALEAWGPAKVTGDLQVLGAASVGGAILARGLYTHDGLPAAEALHTDKDIAVGSVIAAGNLTSGHNITGGGLSVVTGVISRDLTVGLVNGQVGDFREQIGAPLVAATNVRASDSVYANYAFVEQNVYANVASANYGIFGSVESTGLVTGTGGLKADYVALGAVWPAAGHLAQFFTLPAAMRMDAANLLIDVLEYSDSSGTRTYWSPKHLQWNTTVNGDVTVALADGYSGGTVYFRLRVWKTR